MNWYRATGLRISKPEDVPQEMQEVHSDAMRIFMPHLVLGKNDTALLLQSYTGLTELCHDVTINEVTNADHWLHHQFPEELSKAILTWLDQQRQRLLLPTSVFRSLFLQFILLV